MLTALGLLGSVLFSIACLPTSYMAAVQGRNPGVPVMTAWLLFVALACYTSWCFLAFGFHLPFIAGFIEIASWAVVLFYHYYPRCPRGLNAIH